MAETQESKRQNLMSASTKGIMSLSIRSFLSYFLQIISSYIMAQNLSREDFGYSGIVQGILGSLVFFTDVGLGDVLSRKKEAMTASDYSSYFLFRLSLAIFWCLLFFVFVTPIKDHYGLNFQYSQYLWLLGLLIPLEVISAIPKIVLSKNLDFKKLSQIELIAMVVSYIVQISLSYMHFGPWCFFYALFAGKIVAVVLGIFSTKFSFDFKHVSFDLLKDIKKGFYFQLGVMIPVTTTMLIPYVYSFFLGMADIGLIFWMDNMVRVPVFLIMNYNQVTFVTLAKIHDQVDEYKLMLNQLIKWMALAICLVFGLGSSISSNIITLVFPAKWHSANQYIEWVCLYWALYSLRYLSNSIFTSLNRPEGRFKHEFILLIFTMISLSVLLKYFGIWGQFYAISLSYLISSIWIYFELRAYINQIGVKRILASFFAMVISMILIKLLKQHFDNILLNAFLFLGLFTIISNLIDPSVVKDLIIFYQSKIRKKMVN